MRKLKLQVQVSIDGFMAGPNGAMDWMEWNWDDALKAYVAQLTSHVDTIIMGRKLAEGFIPHWADNPELEGADMINNAQKIVFTNTLDAITNWQNVQVAKGEIEEEVKALKAKQGNDIIVYGGATFVQALIEHNLIDEYHLFVNPTALGRGMPVFAELAKPLALKLVHATAFDCGITVLQYNKP